MQKAKSAMLDINVGASFDRAYMKATVNDYQKVIEMLEREITDGQDASIKQLASESLADVQEHLKMAQDLLAIANHLLAGEILYREGKAELAIAELRKAAAIEDMLRYSEPPDWIHPIRHALGATLLKEKRAAEAEKVYREDLVRQPNNGWSLFGLAQSLHLQNKHAEAAAMDAKFAEVWKDADIKITSSCYCQP
jgi:tetratricopeptide (TPR) repeat protein